MLGKQTRDWLLAINTSASSPQSQESFTAKLCVLEVDNQNSLVQKCKEVGLNKVENKVELEEIGLCKTNLEV